MATVNEILEFIGLLAPEYMKESWDRVGLNCGHGDREVHKVLVALDPFDEVCEEAAEIGADLLVTHHALIWEPGFVNDQTTWGKCALYLIENGIIGLVSIALALLFGHASLGIMSNYVASMGIVLSYGRIYPMELMILFAVLLLSILPTMLRIRVMAKKDSALG